MKKIVVGLLLVGAVLLAGFQLNQSVSQDKKVYESYEELSSLTIEDQNSEVYLEAIDGDEPYVSISYMENNKYRYEIEQNGGELVLVKHKNWSAFLTSFLNNFQLGDNSVYVEISQAALEDLNIKTSNSDISIVNVVSQNANLETSNSEITFSDDKVAESLMATTSNGQISLDSSRIGSAYLTTSNDEIYLDDLILTESLVAKTSNGMVDGYLRGKRSDYTVTSDTSNGSNTLGNGGSGDKTIEVYTSNDDINFEFLG
ncbi:DUF4097 family beta strand repeat-containing protein [Enterococcus sp. LJL90]